MLGTASDISWAIPSSSCCRRRLPSARQRWRIATELKKENKKLKLNFVFEMSETKWNEMKWNKWVTPHCACSNCKYTQWDDALLCLRSPSLVYICLRHRLGDKVWHCSHIDVALSLNMHAERAHRAALQHVPLPFCTVPALSAARRSLVLVLSHSLACNWPAPLACCDVALSHWIWMKRRCFRSLIEFACRESASARSIAILRSLCLSVRRRSQRLLDDRLLLICEKKTALCALLHNFDLSRIRKTFCAAIVVVLVCYCCST